VPIWASSERSRLSELSARSSAAADAPPAGHHACDHSFGLAAPPWGLNEPLRGRRPTRPGSPMRIIAVVVVCVPWLATRPEVDRAHARPGAPDDDDL